MAKRHPLAACMATWFEWSTSAQLVSAFVEEACLMQAVLRAFPDAFSAPNICVGTAERAVQVLCNIRRVSWKLHLDFIRLLLRKRLVLPNSS